MKNTIQFLLTIFFGLTINGIAAQETINGTIMHDNLEREYILYVPPNYDEANPVPVVFNFHGYTSNSNAQMFYGDFRPLSNQAGFLIVHPQGTLDQSGITHFNVGWGGSTVDDVGFTNALLDSIAAEYTVNMDRVYSTGMSNGGFMSYLLACESSSRFAAVASVTGSMTPNFFPSCASEHPMPVLEIHGTNDETVPYTGAVFSTDIDEVISYWVSFNNCNTEPTIESIEDTNTTDGSTVDHFVYSNGDNGVHTELFKITDGGHTWPGTSFLFGSTNLDINASQEIWKFFDRYDINGLRKAVSANSIQAETIIEVFPNPSTGIFNIRFEDDSQKVYFLYSIKGKVIKEGTFDTQQAKLDISALPESLYFLKIENQLVKIFKHK